MYTVNKNKEQGRVSCPLLIKIYENTGAEYSGDYGDEQQVKKWLIRPD